MIGDLAFGVVFFSFGFDRNRSMSVFWMIFDSFNSIWPGLYNV